ncbi:MAG: dihydrolipoyl dehydrogenase [Gammaproteobacteria bacterium]|nr:dihydrolipoyl dehydrogenase [Gammaproteobacteria bacterium]
MQQFDVIIIGAGPAGYVAAIRCAQSGLKTACVDKWLNQDGKPSPGGTCLNVGCIPSKALLESSALFDQVNNDYAAHGINCETVELDLATMMKRKNKIVTDLTSGISTLFSANKIKQFTGHAKLLKDKLVEIQLNGKTETIKGVSIILAPGSTPRELDNIKFNHTTIVDSSDALSFNKVPEKLGIIGSGVIGLELGSVWNRLGSEVTILEALPDFLPGADKKLARQALSLYKKQGLQFNFNALVKNVAPEKNKITVEFELKGENNKMVFDKLIVAVGRQANTLSICAEDTGLEIDKQGKIVVNEKCLTNLPRVYAIGDAVRGPMLAHKGSEEGIMVANIIAGHYAHLNYDTIPFVIYTHPEIAWCGLTEEQLKQNGTQYNSGQFSFAANGRARAAGQTHGFVKILADKKTDRILGVHILGEQASELIAQAVVAMEFNSSSEDLAMTLYAHPSLSESIHEAALDVNNQAIHKA